MSTTPSVKDLRAAGNKVRVYHYRRCRGDNNLIPRKDFEKGDVNMDTKGGKTTVEIACPNGQTLVGEALCSKNDNFNRKRGLYIAVARALRSASPQS